MCPGSVPLLAPSLNQEPLCPQAAGRTCEAPEKALPQLRDPPPGCSSHANLHRRGTWGPITYAAVFLGEVLLACVQQQEGGRLGSNWEGCPVPPTCPLRACLLSIKGQIYW